MKMQDDDFLKQATGFDNLFSGDWFDFIAETTGQSILTRTGLTNKNC